MHAAIAQRARTIRLGTALRAETRMSDREWAWMVEAVGRLQMGQIPSPGVGAGGRRRSSAADEAFTFDAVAAKWTLQGDPQAPLDQPSVL